jgi:hypothetical protein
MHPYCTKRPEPPVPRMSGRESTVDHLTKGT